MALIFLTGATGFVGRHLAPALLEDGHHLRCLVRSEQQRLFLQALGCEIVVGDLTRPGWQGSLQGAEVLIHLAALHRGSPSLIQRTNAEGTTRLVHAAQAHNVHKILYLSTVTATNRPSWPYAHSAWLAEQAICQSSLDYTILRCSIIIGPGDPFLGSILRMAQQWPVVPIVGSGETKFQPISVYDIVRCVRALVTDPENRYTQRMLSVGGPEVLSYRQIVATILESLKLNKRIIYAPRRATRLCVRWLERLGVVTPFVPGYFLTRDHIAHSPTVIEAEFGFRPKTLREVIAGVWGGCAGIEKSVL